MKLRAKHLRGFLYHMCACEGSLSWLRTLEPEMPIYRVWQSCPDASWLVWFVDQVDHKTATTMCIERFGPETKVGKAQFDYYGEYDPDYVIDDLVDRTAEAKPSDIRGCVNWGSFKPLILKRYERYLRISRRTFEP